MEFFSGIDATGWTIIILACVILIWIMYYSIRKNYSIYKFLIAEIQKMDTQPNQAMVFTQLKNNYNKLKENTRGDINLTSFVDEFIASYRISEQKREIVRSLKLIQMMPSTAILIGVLGTFIGLVFSIYGIGEQDNGAEIQAALSGIHTAFFTSIAGIIVSLVINFILRLQNSEHLIVQLMLKIENALFVSDKDSLDIQMIQSLVDVKSSIEQMSAAFVGLIKVSEGFEKATVNMNSFNQMFQSNTKTLSRLFGRIENNSQTLQDNMEGIATEFQAMNKFLEKQAELQGNSLTQISSMNSSMMEFMGHQNRLQAEQAYQWSGVVEQIKKMTHQSEESHKRERLFHEKHLEKQTQLIEVQQKFELESRTLLEQVADTSEQMHRVLDTLQEKDITAPIEDFYETLTGMNSQFEGVFNRFEQFMQEQDKYQEFTRDMDERVQRREQQFADNLLLLTESMTAIKEQNGEMGQLFATTQKYHTEFTQSSGMLAEEMKHAMEHTEHIFESTNTMMKEQLVTLHEKMNEFVTLSNDNMNNLMNKMDYSLGDNLKPIMESLKVYMNISNDIIDRKLQGLLDAKSLQSGLEVYSLQSLEHAINKLESSLNNATDDKNKQAALSL